MHRSSCTEMVIDAIFSWVQCQDLVFDYVHRTEDYIKIDLQSYFEVLSVYPLVTFSALAALPKSSSST